MGRTKPYGFDLVVFGREQPRPDEVWMARHAVPGGIVTASVLGAGAGFAFALTIWWLGVIAGIVYAAIGVALWAQPVRRVSAWRRKQRVAERMFMPYERSEPIETFRREPSLAGSSSGSSSERATAGA